MLNSCETVRKYKTDRGFVCRANSHVRAKSEAGMYSYLSLKRKIFTTANRIYAEGLWARADSNSKESFAAFRI